MGIIGKLVLGALAIFGRPVDSLCRNNNTLTSLWLKTLDNGEPECLQDPTQRSTVPNNCGSGNKFIYAKMANNYSVVPTGYECHSQNKTWVSAHVMHHSTGCNHQPGDEIPDGFIDALQKNFFAASKQLNNEMVKCEGKLVEWIEDDDKCGAIDAENFITGDCGNDIMFPNGQSDTDNCTNFSNPENIKYPEYLFCGKGIITYYKGVLVRDGNNKVKCDFPQGNNTVLCSINITNGETYNNVISTNNYIANAPNTNIDDNFRNNDNTKDININFNRMLNEYEKILDDYENDINHIWDNYDDSNDFLDITGDLGNLINEL